MALSKCLCLRCGYAWFPKVDAEGRAIKPNRCPPRHGCGSPYWDRERLDAEGRGRAIRRGLREKRAAEKKE